MPTRRRISAEPKKTLAATARKPAAARRPSVTPQERYRLIQEAAYFRAEQRDFKPGHDIEDWVAAEAEVDAKVRVAAPRKPRAKASPA